MQQCFKYFLLLTCIRFNRKSVLKNKERNSSRDHLFVMKIKAMCVERLEDQSESMYAHKHGTVSICVRGERKDANIRVYLHLRLIQNDKKALGVKSMCFFFKC